MFKVQCSTLLRPPPYNNPKHETRNPKHWFCSQNQLIRLEHISETGYGLVGRNRVRIL